MAVVAINRYLDKEIDRKELELQLFFQGHQEPKTGRLHLSRPSINLHLQESSKNGGNQLPLCSQKAEVETSGTCSHQVSDRPKIKA